MIIIELQKQINSVSIHYLLNCQRQTKSSTNKNIINKTKILNIIYTNESYKKCKTFCHA